MLIISVFHPALILCQRSVLYVAGIDEATVSLFPFLAGFVASYYPRRKYTGHLPSLPRSIVKFGMSFSWDNIDLEGGRGL